MPWAHFLRLVQLVLGFQFVGLGIAGIFIPGLPATPFFLLAAYFFSRSSPRLHRWLLDSPLAGPLIRDWQERGGVRPGVKILALTLMPLVLGSSIYFGGLNIWLSALLIVVGIVGAVVVIRLPRTRDKATAANSTAITTMPRD